jgi:hypothetical protein
VVDVKILSGFTSNVPVTSRGGFFFGIGTPAVSVYLSSAGSPPFGSNEYVAVAVRRGLLLPRNVALAYRLVGLNGPAEPAGLGFTLLSGIFGLMGVTNLIVFPHSTTKSLALSLLLIAIGLLSARRLYEIWSAKRLLSKWEPTPPP